MWRILLKLFGYRVVCTKDIDGFLRYRVVHRSSYGDYVWGIGKNTMFYLKNDGTLEKFNGKSGYCVSWKEV